MKGIFAALLAALLCLGLASCAAGDAPDTGTPEPEPPAPAAPAEPAPLSQPEPEAQPAPAAQPEPEEPDYALYIAGEPIPTVEGCGVTDQIPVYFINRTGEDGYVLDIPHLEKLDGDGAWVPVPYRENIGFCGTPSTLPAQGREWSESISVLWGSLEDGHYRLSYAVGPTFDTEETASGEFTLFTPENSGGLPLAPQS